MCVLTTTMVAGGLAAIGATGLASSATAVGVATLGANMVLGAGLSAGIGAASGQRGSDLWRSAAIGAAGAGIGTGLGMAVNGVSTAMEVSTTLTPQQQLALGATDVQPGMVNQGTEVAALTNNPTLATSQNALPQTTQVVGKTPGMIETGASAASLAKVASVAVQGAGGAVESYGNYQQGKMEAKSLKDQAELERLRAGQVHEAAAMEKMDLARRQRMTIGKGRTVAAANGIMLESRAESSPNMWEQDAMAELAYEQSKIDYNANQRAWGHMANAGVLRDNARTARRTGNLKAVTSLVRAGVGMGVSYFGQYYGSPYTAGRTSYYA